MQKVKTQSALFKIAILSISLMLMIAPNIAAAIPLMAKTFSNQSASAVQTLSTIPNLGVIFGIFFGEVVTLRIGAKRTVMTGLTIALIAGVTPVFLSNYTIVLVTRFLLGFGIGLFNSLALSLISQFYEGNELATMMGFQSTVSNLGSSVLSFAVSYLIIFGWHATFLIYAIALPIMILFGVVVPNIDRQDIREAKTQRVTTSKPAGKQRLNMTVIAISVLTFFVYVFFMVVTVQLSSLFVDQHIGSASQASAVLGGLTLVSMLFSLFYGKFFKWLGSAILPLGLFLMAIGFLLLSRMQAMGGVPVGVVIIGIGFAFAIPYIATMVNVKAPKGSENLASSVMLIMTNAGVFLSPTVVNALSGVFGHSGPVSAMVVCASGLFVLAIVTAVVVVTRIYTSRAAASEK